MTQFRFQKSQVHPQSYGQTLGEIRDQCLWYLCLLALCSILNYMQWIYFLQLPLLAVFFESGTEMQPGCRKVLANHATAMPECYQALNKHTLIHACMLIHTTPQLTVFYGYFFVYLILTASHYHGLTIIVQLSPPTSGPHVLRLQLFIILPDFNNYYYGLLLLSSSLSPLLFHLWLVYFLPFLHTFHLLFLLSFIQSFLPSSYLSSFWE